MRVLISAQAPDITAPLDPRFGRAAHFVVVDAETGEWQAHANPAAMAGHGAGIEAARFAVDQGVEAVITGATGPNAFRTLEAAGVLVFQAPAGTVADALEAWRGNELPAAGQPTAPAHAGMAPQAPGAGAGSGGGGGAGMGRGGGAGMGGGGGAGMGRGGGGGMGRGGGGGGGAGMGRGGGGGGGAGMGGGRGRGGQGRG